VQVREFQGKIYVDIREHYQKQDGNMAPSRKGIAITVENWEKFLGHIEDINKAIA